MNWIEEIRYEIRQIKESPKELRKFGITIGGILLVIALVAFWKEWLFFSTIISIAVFGLLLVFLGIVQPNLLKKLNKVWMSFAIILGSVVSRIILAIVFFIIVTPISLFAKALGKKFYFSYKDQKQQSYWIMRDKSKSINYERMN